MSDLHVIMSNTQREILAYCAEQPRTYADLIEHFGLSNNETEFYRAVFGDDLKSFYDIDLSASAWESTAIRASEKGIAYLQSVYLSDTRWKRTHRLAVVAIVISVLSLLVSIAAKAP